MEHERGAFKVNREMRLWLRLRMTSNRAVCGAQPGSFLCCNAKAILP